MEWQLLDDDDARERWDAMLAGFPDANLYQSFAWGEYRRRLAGARPCRWLGVDAAGAPVALFQGLLVGRSMGCGVVTGVGGPVGRLDDGLETLGRGVRETLGLRACYCRVAPRRPYAAGDALLLHTCRWKRALVPSGSQWSMALDLTGGEEALTAGLSQNWRRNLQRAQRRNPAIDCWHNPEPEAILGVYHAMETLKGLPQEHSAEEIAALVSALGAQLLLLRCRDERGAVVALRGCAITGAQALDLFAAATEEARKTYASYALLWELLRACRRRGVTRYDLNGIDPYANPGVYNFKKGTGAAAFEYLGEWDWATSERLRIAMSFLRARRHERAKQRRITAA